MVKIKTDDLVRIKNDTSYTKKGDIGYVDNINNDGTLEFTPLGSDISIFTGTHNVILMEDIKKLSEYSGKVYDLAYDPKLEIYKNTEEFINDICNIEIDLAIADEPKDYRKDEYYIKYKTIKDNQEISEKELNNLLDVYDYTIE